MYYPYAYSFVLGTKSLIRNSFPDDGERLEFACYINCLTAAILQGVRQKEVLLSDDKGDYEVNHVH